MKRCSNQQPKEGDGEMCSPGGGEGGVSECVAAEGGLGKRGEGKSRR